MGDKPVHESGVLRGEEVGEEGKAMLYTICGWYSLILFILALLITISKDSTSTTNYTGRFKVISIFAYAPIVYFIATSLFK